ncbi:DUF4870 domain-containing protein [Lysinibacillus odysseyi]|uniref:DUF4870 domain-containing protein n=1 Tax=Lysinibacillus odysseyi 34hs-1 = NBRC 100172 TaxID=1220589 RepID=A0A0A3IUA8_9BACI|nr:DUF4870 domain-containing protein [Lysinibacillus odysseyi]KGR87045.1 hypothetical protein CD32_04765 [Lysinibacillus odysseyi 34hs-1 = NBRC 100172]
MDTNKGLSALNYFSVFFAPFIVPIIVYFVSSDPEVKRHAMRALLSHIIPIILGIVLFILLFAAGLFGAQGSEDTVFIMWVVFVLGYGILYLAITIWNVVQGIKVLR